MDNLKMYVSIFLVVVSTVGGGFYKFTIGPIKSQLSEQQLVIQEQAKELGRLTQLIESVTATNSVLKSENEVLLEQVKGLRNQLDKEKARSTMLELGLKEAKVTNEKMSELVDKQNRKVKLMLDVQKKNKDKMVEAQNKAKKWQGRYETISRSAKTLPVGDCEQAAYLYDEYHKLRSLK